MIDEQRTLEIYGYTSDMLSLGSNKPIIRVCEECGKYNEVIFNKYNQYKNYTLCLVCSHKDKLAPNWKGGLVIKTCEICGNEFKSASSTNQKFCSKKCKNKWHSENFSGENNSSWKGGITDQPYCKLWTKKFRQLIRDCYHNKCYLCNITKENNNNRNLSVHHVNYNKNCLCQKTCEFVPLCSKCHGKTNKNRQTWEDLIMNYLYPNRYFMVDF